jgi:hypothetical protein
MYCFAMSRRWWFVVVLASTGCMSPVMTFGGNNSTQAQYQTLDRETPPGLAVAEEPGEHPPAVQTARVRVWADDDYRAQNVHWEKTFQESLDYANEVLTAQFGVQLVAEYHAWDHHDQAAPITETLAALVEKDPGDGAFTVIGLTSALGLAESKFETIGFAELPGHHLVVRGYADVAERDSFERYFTDLQPEERASLYEARRRHKGAALLLHELGHNLGANHVADGVTLMNPQYSTKSSAFDAASRDAIRATVDERLHRKRVADPVAHAPAAGAVGAVAAPALVVAIDASGRALVGGAPMDEATLDGLLKLTFEDDHDAAVLVTFSRKASQAVVVKVVDRVKAAGLTHVSIAPQ